MGAVGNVTLNMIVSQGNLTADEIAEDFLVGYLAGVEIVMLYCSVLVINVVAILETTALLAAWALKAGVVLTAILVVMTVYSVVSEEPQKAQTYASLLMMAFLGTVEAYGIRGTATVSGSKGTKSVSTEDIKTANNPLENIVYTDKVKKQMQLGDYHSFPSSVDGFGASGKITTITGGDKLTRTLIEIQGSYRGIEGEFQYIIEPDGITCNHRLFVPDV